MRSSQPGSVPSVGVPRRVSIAVSRAGILDHLIAADHALTNVRRMAVNAVLAHEIQPQDLNEWVEQLHDRLNTITH